MLARRERNQTDQARLMEQVTQHIVANTVESAMGTKKGAGKQAAESVRFLDEHRGKQASRRVARMSQVTSMFGRPTWDVPAGKTVSEVMASA